MEGNREEVSALTHPQCVLAPSVGAGTLAGGGLGARADFHVAVKPLLEVRRVDLHVRPGVSRVHAHRLQPHGVILVRVLGEAQARVVVFDLIERHRGVASGEAQPSWRNGRRDAGAVAVEGEGPCHLPRQQ